MNTAISKSDQLVPKVAVCVVTYNQEELIKECLLSLINQETDFNYEVLVSDDHSSDKTSEIVSELAKIHPHKIKYFRQPINIGAYKNYIYTHAWAKSTGCEYIAHVDGDDFALPGKLQKQADLLDRNPDISLSAHAVKVVGQNRYIGLEKNLPIKANTEDLLKFGAYFVNSSTMYRAKNFKARAGDSDVIDYIHYMEQSAHGHIHLCQDILGEYRWHDLGISKSESHRNRIESAYDRAFAYAQSIGISTKIIARARLKRRLSFAIAALVDKRRDIFRKKIKLSPSEWHHATWNHRILSFGRILVRGKIEKILIDRFTGKS